jgi:hypothetical protein
MSNYSAEQCAYVRAIGEAYADSDCCTNVVANADPDVGSNTQSNDCAISKAQYAPDSAANQSADKGTNIGCREDAGAHRCANT